MKKLKTYVAMLFVVMLMLALGGCGMKNAKDKDNAEATTGWSVANPDNTTEDRDTTESTGDVKDDIKDAAEDAGDIMDNLGAGTFDTYEDAKNYLKDKLETDHEDVDYEFREETQDLTSYDSANPGAEGYEFHVYESEDGKKTGDYYVDKDTGKVYLYTKDNKITEY